MTDDPYAFTTTDPRGSISVWVVMDTAAIDTSPFTGAKHVSEKTILGIYTTQAEAEAASDRIGQDAPWGRYIVLEWATGTPPPGCSPIFWGM
jgi:hypothetical protein